VTRRAGFFSWFAVFGTLYNFSLFLGLWVSFYLLAACLSVHVYSTSKTPPTISANSSLPTFPGSPSSFFNPRPRTNIRPSSGFREQSREASCVARSCPRVSREGVPVPPRIVVAGDC